MLTVRAVKRPFFYDSPKLIEFFNVIVKLKKKLETHRLPSLDGQKPRCSFKLVYVVGIIVSFCSNILCFCIRVSLLRNENTIAKQLLPGIIYPRATTINLINLNLTATTAMVGGTQLFEGAYLTGANTPFCREPSKCRNYAFLWVKSSNMPNQSF